MLKQERTPKNRTRLMREDGNVLIIIFISIALMAALTFTITRMGGDSANVMTKSQAATAATTIIGYASKLEAATQMVMAQGTTENTISFENSTISGYTNAAAANTDKIFNSAGGGMKYEVPNADWFDSSRSAMALYRQWYFPANTCVAQIGGSNTFNCHSDGSSASEDLVVVLPYLKKEVCDAINAQLGLASASSANENNWPAANTKFTGSYADGGRIFIWVRVEKGCFQGGGTANQPVGTYHFYATLLPR